jgi:predicted TPR repeat methyltransferase
MDHRHLSGDPLADRRADYAKGLATDGDHAAAADLMRQALDLAPAWVAGWTTLGTYLADAGGADEAAKAFARALALDPSDGTGAALRLAAMGRAPAPATAPAAFVKGLFDQYAGRFDAALVDGLAYEAPDRLMDAILGVAGNDARFGTALDLGCGTGLMGERLRPRAARLEGLDLSPEMLARARAKRIYDALEEGDILALDAGTRIYDLAAAADVLNYVGDLVSVVGTIAGLLAPGGLFAFTLEASDGPAPYRLGEALRYAHHAPAVEAMLQAAGLILSRRDDVVLRQDRGSPVAGHVLVAQRSA